VADWAFYSFKSTYSLPIKNRYNVNLANHITVGLALGFLVTTLF